jgi:hypothetical protein
VLNIPTHHGCRTSGSYQKSRHRSFKALERSWHCCDDAEVPPTFVVAAYPRFEATQATDPIAPPRNPVRQKSMEVNLGSPQSFNPFSPQIDGVSASSSVTSSPSSGPQKPKPPEKPVHLKQLVLESKEKVVSGVFCCCFFLNVDAYLTGATSGS